MSTISWTSPSASGYGLPISCVTSRASASLLSSTSRPTLAITRPRAGAGSFFHSACAARAARAASTKVDGVAERDLGDELVRVGGVRGAERAAGSVFAPRAVDDGGDEHPTTVSRVAPPPPCAQPSPPPSSPPSPPCWSCVTTTRSRRATGCRRWRRSPSAWRGSAASSSTSCPRSSASPPATCRSRRRASSTASAPPSAARPAPSRTCSRCWASPAAARASTTSPAPRASWASTTRRPRR